MTATVTSKRRRKPTPKPLEPFHPKTLFVNPRRHDLLEQIAALATELCVSVDRAADDIGGSRPALVILQEIGPLTSRLEEMPK